MTHRGSQEHEWEHVKGTLYHCACGAIGADAAPDNDYGRIEVHAFGSEVPATNDPSERVIVDWVRHEQSGHVLPVHAPAEVPADEGTLDTDEVREDFALGRYSDDHWGKPFPESREKFDRWLAAELQKARAEGDEVFDADGYTE